MGKACPVCEHVQEGGSECERCGKPLEPPPSLVVAPSAMPELEGTRFGSTGQLPTPLLAELEGTRLAIGPDLPSSVLPDLERTSSAPVGDIAPGGLPEIETGRAQADSTRTAAPTGPLTCVECGAVQATGLFCDKCGMKLPRAVARAAPSGALAEGMRRCKDCGVPTPIGRSCTNCGGRP